MKNNYYTRKIKKLLRRTKKNFNKEKRKKLYKHTFDKVYQVDYNKCKNNNKKLGSKNKFYSHLCKLSILNPEKRKKKLIT